MKRRERLSKHTFPFPILFHYEKTWISSAFRRWHIHGWENVAHLAYLTPVLPTMDTRGLFCDAIITGWLTFELAIAEKLVHNTRNARNDVFVVGPAGVRSRTQWHYIKFSFSHFLSFWVNHRNNWCILETWNYFLVLMILFQLCWSKFLVCNV